MGIVMWQRLSLRSRINLLMALVLTLGLAINVTRLVLEGGPRVQAEDQSVTRLAREFVETIVGSLNEAPNPEERLDQIVQDLKRLRHVGITWQTDTGAPADIHGEEDDAQSVPGWFVTLVHPRTTAVSVPRARRLSSPRSRTTRSPKSGMGF
jgi:two-component system sensor histidine kinase UhpB